MRIVPAHADIADIEVIFVDETDEKVRVRSASRDWARSGSSAPQRPSRARMRPCTAGDTISWRPNVQVAPKWP